VLFQSTLYSDFKLCVHCNSANSFVEGEFHFLGASNAFAVGYPHVAQVCTYIVLKLNSVSENFEMKFPLTRYEELSSFFINFNSNAWVLTTQIE
jgi:hypothetical protein